MWPPGQPVTRATIVLRWNRDGRRHRSRHAALGGGAAGDRGRRFVRRRRDEVFGNAPHQTPCQRCGQRAPPPTPSPSSTPKPNGCCATGWPNCGRVNTSSARRRAGPPQVATVEQYENGTKCAREEQGQVDVSLEPPRCRLPKAMRRALRQPGCVALIAEPVSEPVRRERLAELSGEECHIVPRRIVEDRLQHRVNRDHSSAPVLSWRTWTTPSRSAGGPCGPRPSAFVRYRAGARTPSGRASRSADVARIGRSRYRSNYGNRPTSRGSRAHPSLIVCPKADLDRVLHHGAQHLAELVCGLRLVGLCRDQRTICSRPISAARLSPNLLPSLSACSQNRSIRPR